MAESWMGLRGYHKVQAGRQGMRPSDGAAERQRGKRISLAISEEQGSLSACELLVGVTQLLTPGREGGMGITSCPLS